MVHLSKLTPSSWDFKTRVFVLAVAPVVLVAVILSSYVASSRMQDVEQSLLDRGNALIDHMARMSEFGLFTGNQDLLTSLTQSALVDNDVSKVMIFDETHSVIASSIRSGDVGALSVKLASDDERNNDYLFIEKPIYDSGVQAFDFSEEFAVPSDNDVSRTHQPMGWVEVVLSSRSTKERRKEILLYSLLITLFGLIVSISLAVRISHGVTGPVRRLSLMERKLRGGDFGARVEVKSGGDLGVLEEGFNELARTLGRVDYQLKQQIKAAVEELTKTVAKLESQNRELDSAKNAALRASEAKADFLAKMSHEIRTPMNAVIGFTELLRKTKQNREQVEYTRTIHQSAQQLLNVIEDILSISKLESGTDRVQRMSFDVRNCLEDVVSMLGPTAHRKSLELVLLVDSDVPERLLGDPGRLSQVLINLVNNAIKFTPKGSVTVEVSLEALVDHVARLRVSVMDTGIGIAKGNQTDLFAAFVQADSSMSRRFGGSGLGLTIAKRFVELMGGDISFESELGRGSTFRFRVSCDLDVSTEISDYATILQHVVALIYDGNPFSRRAIRNNLLLAGASTFVSRTLAQVPAMLEGQDGLPQSYNVLILSLGASEISEPDLEECVVSIRRIYSGPILILVSREDYELSPTMVKDGMISSAVKPVRRDTLYLKLHTLSHQNKDHTGLDALRGGSPDLNSNLSFNKYHGVKLLLVEDNEFNRILVSTLLTQKGLCVELAGDGQQAWMAARAEKYDIILMDIHLPIMNGEEATRKIRTTDGPNRDTPVIALTADIFSDKQGGLTAAGISDFVFKPISEDKLFEKLDLWLWKNKASPQRDSALTSGLYQAQPIQEMLLEAEGSSVAPPPVPEHLLEKLYQELPLRRVSLADAIEKGDFKLLLEQAHQLNGVAGYFAFTDLALKARALEKAAASGNTREVAINYHAVSLAIETIVEEHGEE